MNVISTQVLIIGAGPSGAVAAAALRKQGREVLVLERAQFPRFSIGESLLPQSMVYLEEVGLLRDVVEAGFQYKNGAAFARGRERSQYDFRDKFSEGWGTTYQVQRADFDQVLAKAAARMGATVRFGHEVKEVNVEGPRPVVFAAGPDGEAYRVEADFLLDASGYGRVLPRLLGLERPTGFPVRGAIFTHVEDHFPASFDRNKILITVHRDHPDVWFWSIPFSGGRASVGVVATREFLDALPGDDLGKLRAAIASDPDHAEVLANAVWDTPVRKMVGYSASVTSLHGPGWALLGNAGEFLDPVFSSGVTVAFRSAHLAAKAIEKQFSGAQVDWEAEFAVPLMKGVATFRTFVESWYRGGFQDVVFYKEQTPEVRRMISAILAGYAWDTKNPYVADHRRLSVLEELCRAS
jgi:flavin-dependent dehydrogenase